MTAEIRGPSGLMHTVKKDETFYGYMADGIPVSIYGENKGFIYLLAHHVTRAQAIDNHFTTLCSSSHISLQLMDSLIAIPNRG